jgi:hypothetical protein
MMRGATAILLAVIAAASAGPQTGAQAGKTVRFVQITDAHIYDDGWKLPVADALRQAADDRDALTWAVNEINAEVQGGERVDFVMYSGDLGLQNVDFAGSGCQLLETTMQPGLPPFELRGAVDEIAHLLETLTVPRVYFTPGNNDLEEEKVQDAGRVDCFVHEVEQRLIADKSKVQVTVLNPANSFTAGGVRFVALDTAMFKNRANYETFCAADLTTGAALLQGCPQNQLLTLDAAVRSSAEPVAIFLHVPDLRDPFRRTSSWDLSDPLRTEWVNDVCSAKVIGVFAGHFHDANRAYYGVPSKDLETKGCVGEKTYVAPPLAAKNQTGKAPQARGLMSVEIENAKTVAVRVTWYPGHPARTQ